MDRRRISAALREWFDAGNQSQTDIAAAIGVNQGHVSRLLSGDFGPRSRVIIKLCKYAKIDPALYEDRKQDVPQDAFDLFRRVLDGRPSRKRSVMRVLQALVKFE